MRLFLPGFYVLFNAGIQTEPMGKGLMAKSKFMIGRLLSVQSGVYSPKRLLLSWAMTFVG